MSAYRGLTWDHPRGYNALAAAAAQLDPERDGLVIAWDRHSLEGFESRSIVEQCALYDLVVIDHPHVGEAVAQKCLVAVEELFGGEEISAWRDAVAGPSLASYLYAGRHWALPLDAATQVLAYRPDLVPVPPTSWADVIGLASTVPIALSLAGPHAILSFQSIAGSLGAAPGTPRDEFLAPAVAAEAYAVMAALAVASAPFADLNPIAMLELMSRSRDIALCPLIYGYVNYAPAGTVAFANAPHGPGGEIGSTLGGTGIGVSRRCEITPALLNHLRWLMSDATQRDFIPAHDGQPALRAAWTDPAVNARWGAFYEATLESVEQALLRPRHDGAIAFQAEASRRLREGLLAGEPAEAVLADIDAAYRRHHPTGAET
jgi:multiple sugar transport system substrate-binding protein